MYGISGGSGLHHSQSVEGWFQNVPGLKIVMPSTPYDYQGLLKASVRDDDPVLFLEHKMSYKENGEVPEEEYTVPLCQTDIKRRGEDVTVVALGPMVKRTLGAADSLASDGIDIEVVDPRTVCPLDIDPILESVKKTHTLVVAHEAPTFGGLGGEIVSQVSEKALFYLDAPVKRVGGPFTPVPFAENLEEQFRPDESDVEAAVREVVAE
jgi:pyruvate dehydrogenase E1 component beta subunit